MTCDTGSVCAVLLAGGKSSRMGEDKAFLKYDGQTFLEIAIKKLSLINADEMIISGDPDILSPPVEAIGSDKKIRIIPDLIRDKGPLGGLYSCFLNTKCEHALVLGLDTPLVSKETLEYIISSHLQNKKDATVLTVASFIEPLIAAYSTSTVSVIRKLIDEDKLYMKALLKSINTSYLPFRKDPAELLNCNTRSDYDKLTALRS